MTLRPEVLIDDLHFPECLRWRDGELWFSDMLAGTVHRSAEGRVDTVAALPDHSGGLGWLPDGDLLVVAMRTRQVHRLSRSGDLRLHADLTPLLTHPANDMYVDPAGRAYVSSYGYDADNGAPMEKVRLVIVEPDGTVRFAGEPLAFPNGIDRRADDELLVSEMASDRVSRVPLTTDGAVGGPIPLVALGEGDGPDGVCCDDTGVWVACAFGEKAVHVSAGGEVDEVIPIPGKGVLCPLVGGPRRRTLYLAVAPTDEEYAARHRAGSILAVELD